MTGVVPGHGQSLTSLPMGLQSAAGLENHSCDVGSFPHSSVGKESACNAGDPGSIPGLGRSAGEGIGYPPQYSWASLVAQLVKNAPALQETWVRSLGWENPLEKGKATHSSILAWRIPWTKEPDRQQSKEHRGMDLVERASGVRSWSTSICWTRLPTGSLSLKI